MVNRNLSPARLVRATDARRCQTPIVEAMEPRQLLSSAVSYSAVSNFTGSNPSGTWSYLWGSSVGAHLSPLTSKVSFGTHWTGLGTGKAVPNSVTVTRNYGPGTASYLTIVDPTNLLNIDPESDVADVRWTAPTTATHSISGLFQMTDTDSHAHEVRVLLNDQPKSPLLAGVLSSPKYGQQVPFSFSEHLTAGETLDFIVNCTSGFSYLSTGLAATITEALT